MADLERRLLNDSDSVVLAAGSHPSPGHGMCAVEAASLIAGEPFSDRPVCVCPVIASFVRAWNDRLHHGDRQRLRPYVSQIVNSRGDRRLTRERRELFLSWADGVAPGSARPGPLGRLWRRARIGVACGLAAAIRFDDGAGEYAARVAVVRGDIDAALGLLAESLGIEPVAATQTLGTAQPDQIPSWLTEAAQGRWPQPDKRSRPSHGRALDVTHPRRRQPDEPVRPRTPRDLTR